MQWLIACKQSCMHQRSNRPHTMKSLVAKLKIKFLLTSIMRYIGYCVEQPKIKKKNFLIFLFVKLRPFLTGLSRDHNNSVRR